MSASLAAALSTPERLRLTDLEEVVDRGLRTFVEVGHALSEIRASRLYRESHPTFAAYCHERWGFSDSRARQLIAGAKTVTDVTAAGLPAPKTEGEARRVAVDLREKTGEAVDLREWKKKREAIQRLTGAEPGRVSRAHSAWNAKAVERVYIGLARCNGGTKGMLAPEVFERAFANPSSDDLKHWESSATEIISRLTKFRRAVRVRRDELSDLHGAEEWPSS